MKAIKNLAGSHKSTITSLSVYDSVWLFGFTVTHHDTAVCHRDVLKCLHTEGATTPLALGQSAQRKYRKLMTDLFIPLCSLRCRSHSSTGKWQLKWSCWPKGRWVVIVKLSFQDLPTLGPAVGAPGVRGHWRSFFLTCSQWNIVLSILETKSTQMISLQIHTNNLMYVLIYLKQEWC